MPGQGPVNGRSQRASCPRQGIGCLTCPGRKSCPLSRAEEYTRYDNVTGSPPFQGNGHPPSKTVKLPPVEPQDIMYLYDGSMPGFFCCVFESVYGRELPAGIQPEQQAQPTFFRQKRIVTEEEKALRVQESIPKKISPRALELIEKVFLSCLENKELAMLRFLLLGYREGGRAAWMFGHPDVAPLLAAEKHMMGEQHLLRGFVRFSDYGGALAATISPKNFVLPFLANHFVSRYPNENFMIYDKTHKAALIYENRQLQLAALDSIEFPPVDEEEAEYQHLWKRFYNTVAIEARTNPRCRMTHMPKRYWANMTEMQEFL